LRGAAAGSAATAEVEPRLRLMEAKLTYHAEEIHRGVVERVDRIDSRIQRAMALLAADGEDRCEENVVEFRGVDAGPGQASHHSLPAIAAREALHELNATLKVTREHLDALGASVGRLREAVAKAR